MELMQAVLTIVGSYGGWGLFAVTIAVSLYMALKGLVLSRSTADLFLKIKEDQLDNERNSRELWQNAYLKLNSTAQLNMDSVNRTAVTVEATLKIVTDLQTALKMREEGGQS